MTEELRLICIAAIALVVAMVVSFVSTPVVKAFAQKVGAIDVPKDNRRMHKAPIPRLGACDFLWIFTCSFDFCRNDTAV